MGCLECLIDTAAQFLEGSQKVVYMHHRHFLVEGHRYRSKRMMKYFIGSTIETEYVLGRWDEHYVYNMVKNIKVAYGKKKKDGKINKRDMPSIDGVPLKKMSIFFKYLPYWPDMAVRHSIDGMHIKRMCLRASLEY